ncbi:MAG: tryptophan synthase subunit alpha [Alphaproteobacteria bacterium]|nr:tryptophan synthase subunit alpha [Alphaproteobacteria bacterium]
MSRIEKIFETLNRPALITFITAGDPDRDQSLAVLKSLPGAGADIIELGMPFTDPAADGPAIQHASERALAAGANMAQTLEMVREFRKNNDETPLVLMGYANPLFVYGFDNFAKDAADAGVDGLIIVDLPPEEDADLRAAAQSQNIDLIRLITPTTDEARLEKLLEGASGFLYYVSITGVTGTAQADIGAIRPHIEHIKTRTPLPVAIGFGVKTPQDAKNMAKIADGVVVGSAIVQNMAKGLAQDTLVETIETQVKALSKALND